PLLSLIVLPAPPDPATYPFVDQSKVRWIARNSLGKAHNIFAKQSRALLQIERMPLSLSFRCFVLQEHCSYRWLVLPRRHRTEHLFSALEFEDWSFSGAWNLEFGAFHISTS